MLCVLCLFEVSRWAVALGVGLGWHLFGLGLGVVGARFGGMMIGGGLTLNGFLSPRPC
jgi:hypothetical protein